MNHFSKRDGSKKFSIIVMMLVCVLLSNVSVFGQTTVESTTTQTATIQDDEVVNTNVEMNTMKQEATSNTSNMNFVLWFMGSKQSPNSNALPAGTTAKKQFMTSGSAPNRLLIRAFLKKAVNFEVSMV
jgi:hypothetical protein